MKQKICLVILTTFSLVSLQAAYILLPMDITQKDHLKAYGITYLVLQSDMEAHWLLNYRGGSFAFPHRLAYEKECKTRGVTYQVISDAQFKGIQTEIQDPSVKPTSAYRPRYRFGFTPQFTWVSLDIEQYSFSCS